MITKREKSTQIAKTRSTSSSIIELGYFWKNQEFLRIFMNDVEFMYNLGSLCFLYNHFIFILSLTNFNIEFHYFSYNFFSSSKTLSSYFIFQWIKVQIFSFVFQFIFSAFLMFNFKFASILLFKQLLDNFPVN